MSAAQSAGSLTISSANADLQIYNAGALTVGALSISAGKIDVAMSSYASGALTVNGASTLSGGTLNVNNGGTLTLGATFTQSGGMDSYGANTIVNQGAIHETGTSSTLYIVASKSFVVVAPQHGSPKAVASHLRSLR